MHNSRLVLAAAGAALAMASCGAKVLVDGVGGGPATTGTGGAGVSGTAVSGTGGIVDTGVSVTGTGSGTFCTNSCASAVMNGGAPCTGTPQAMNYQGLYTCGCGPSVCAGACNFTLCTATPVDGTCVTCLKINCGESLTACESD